MKIKHCANVCLLLATAIGLTSSSLRAAEDGLGTNVMRNIRVQPAGVIDLGDRAITNWNQVGSTVDVANLQGATNTLNTSVTNVSYQVTNGLYNATNTLNTSVTNISYQVTNDLFNATNALNTSVTNISYQVTNDLFNATNALNMRAVKWDNAVVIKEGVAGAEVGALVYANLYYFAAGNTWSNACATNSTRAGGLLGLALGPTPATDGLLLNGQCTNAWNFIAGQILYLATNSNQITTNMPTGTNHFVRIVGYAINATNIYFNPDRTYIELLGQ